nr:Tetratricopeptide repeat protein like [Ipomoea batatas]
MFRYLVLGQACCHLGLMEDALVLLQTGKRIATDAFRRESICLSDDSFSFARFPLAGEISAGGSQPQAPPITESESISQLLSHIKLLLRRRTAAIAALNAGLYSEAIRHFSKIVDGRRGAPQGFLAECYMHRASAYRSSGRIAEAIADCNRTLALDPSCIEALSTRAALFEAIRCLPDSLHDLEHLKLLYNSMLRDRRLPGPAWKRQNVQYREIPGRLCSLATKIQELKQRVASGETGNVDYYALIGLRRGCSRSELERAHLLLTLRHKPDKSSGFIERCEYAEERDVESVRERAKMSALLLYRLIQRGYTSLMTTIIDEEAAEKQRKKAAAALQAMQQEVQQQQQPHESKIKPISSSESSVMIENNGTATTTPPGSVFQGVFCRDLAIVGNLLSQAGFNRPLPVKYEALSC